MIDVGTALVYTFAAGLVVFFCRALPFFIIRSGGEEPGGGSGEGPSDGDSPRLSRGRKGAFLSLIEGVVPPVAMTVLAANSVAAPVRADFAGGIPVLAASAFVLAAQLWKRNFLVSILGGTLLYMVLSRVL